MIRQASPKASDKDELKVHLDHLLPRESLRWVGAGASSGQVAPLSTSIPILPFRNLGNEQYSIFPLLRKPDFQRETSAWTPADCVALLESVIDGLIVPSLIIWKNPDNALLYVLDGAHRVSVVHAWMLDDWGDRAPEDYYERHEFADEIRRAAHTTRDLVKTTVGAYDDFRAAGDRYLKITGEGLSPKEKLSAMEFRRGRFFAQLLQGTGFHIQEVQGNYDVAEASFLRINRRGQPLNDWETTLIENRNSSLARTVMSIANGGTGRFWPDNVNDSGLTRNVALMRENAESIHRMLFIPPLQTPIKDANVPLIASTRYFPKHANLLEFLSVIEGSNDVGNLFDKDRDLGPETIIRNGFSLIERTKETLQHITGSSADPLNLAIVPLFYFYTLRGRYVRSSFYGMASWLTIGSVEDLRARKIVFSAHRGRFEQVLFEHDIAGALTRKLGSGLRAVDGTRRFYQDLLELLDSDPSSVTSDHFVVKLEGIQKRLTAPRNAKVANTGRAFTDSQKTSINMKELFGSAIRCQICEGVLDLRYAVQYDHKVPYATSHITDDAQGRPTHPFCNNQRDVIESHRAGQNRIHLPALSVSSLGIDVRPAQLSWLELFDDAQFPDEPVADSGPSRSGW